MSLEKANSFEIIKTHKKYSLGLLKKILSGVLIAAVYGEHLPTFFVRGFRELNAENWDRLLDMFKFESMAEIERICAAAGFSILKSCHIQSPLLEFESADGLRSFFWSATHGVFDPGV